MAALQPEQIVLETSDGDAGMMACFALKNINAGDTADLDQWFSGSIKWAAMGPSTGTASADTCTVSGTTVTVPAGYSEDAAFLLCYGPAA